MRQAKQPQVHQAVLPSAYKAELRVQPAWAECDIDERCASAEKLRIVQLLSAPKKTLEKTQCAADKRRTRKARRTIGNNAFASVTFLETRLVCFNP